MNGRCTNPVLRTVHQVLEKEMKERIIRQNEIKCIVDYCKTNFTWLERRRVNLPELSKAFNIMSCRKSFVKLEKIVVIEEIGLLEGNSVKFWFPNL